MKSCYAIVCVAALVLPVARAEAAQISAPPLDSCLWIDTPSSMVANLSVRYEEDGNHLWRDRSYVRLWQRDMRHDRGDSPSNATVLFALAPAPVRELSYLRWQFPVATRREPNEWVYLPQLKKVRRVTVREAEDMVFRDVEDVLATGQPILRSVVVLDEQRDEKGYKWQAEVEIEGMQVWRGKWWVTFVRGAQTEPCRVTTLEQRDAKGKRTRAIDFEWHYDKQEWYRSMVFVTIVPSAQRASYHFTGVRLNETLPPDLFEPQALRNFPRTLYDGGWLVRDAQ